MRLKTILCPIDRSDISIRALAYATAFAREYAARLSVLEVIDWGLPPLAGLPVGLTDLPAPVQTQVLEHLQTLTAPARAAGVATEHGIEAGPVVRRILERAAAISADLIVVGTHGRQGFDRLALGSVAEKVLRKAACPVLTVPPGASSGPGAELRLNSIVCAVDLSPMSADVVRVGSDIARRCGGELVVAHVVAWPFSEAEGGELPAVWRQGLEARADDALTRLVATEATSAAASTCLLTGTPRDEILACARSRHADLIVIGVSGHGAVVRTVLGATAHAVVRQSECPVLVVRARPPVETGAN